MPDFKWLDCVSVWPTSNWILPCAICSRFQREAVKPVDFEITPKDLLENILKKYPTAPNYKVSETEVKVPAGWLIETAGWKGKTFDNRFGVHKNQALVLVNYGGAIGHEIYNLSEQIMQDIKAKFGIELEREVNII